MYEIDEIVCQKIGSDHNFYIFGASTLGKEFLNNTSINIKGVFDNSKSEGIFENVQILSIEKLNQLNDNSIILITSSYDKEIGEQLNGIGNIKWLSVPFLKRLAEVEKDISSPVINTVMIETTNYCNAICEFCPNSSLVRKKEHMSEEVFDMAVKRVQELDTPPKTFRLHCLGEPLLAPNLINYIKKLKKLFPDSEVGFTSNFSVINDGMINNLIDSGIDYITISLNSTNEENYKKTMGKHMSYAQTLQNIESLINEINRRNYKLKLILSIVETRENKDEVKEFCDRWGKENIEIRVMKLGSWIQGEEKSMLNKPVCGKKDILNRISHRVCSWTMSEICILSNGEYGLCCFDAEGISDMNVKEYSIKDVINSNLWKNVRESLVYGVAENDICENCSFIKGN